MTNEELLRTQLAASLRESGENAFSTRMLRQQLASLEWAKNIPPLGTHQVLVGARGEASEDLQPGEHREDMYGNPVLSPEERAEAEEEE
jgi:hypothetical protein